MRETDPDARDRSAVAGDGLFHLNVGNRREWTEHATHLPAATLRRSTSTVSGSGWLVTYATGSLASMSTVLSCRRAGSRPHGVPHEPGLPAPMSQAASAATVAATATARAQRTAIVRAERP